MKDLGLSDKLISAVSGTMKTSAKQQQEQSQQQAPEYSNHYGKLGAARPLSMEEAKTATQEAHAPARRVAATIRGMYVKEDVNESKKKDANDPYEKETLKKRKERTTGEAVDEGKAHTVPKTDKEKSLAALAEPKSKITHKDVMVGRGVLARESWEDMLKAVREKNKPQPNGGAGMKQGTRYGGGKQKDEKPVKEELNTDTPGNSEHQCAIHVKHSKLGEGRTLFSQHAQPDAEGQIAWYDVMFEHGIQKQVPTTDLEIVVSESHMNHKKKKK